MPSLIIVESDAKAKSLDDHIGPEAQTLVFRSVPMKVTHSLKNEALNKGEDGYKYVPSEEGIDCARQLLNSLGKDIYLAFDSNGRGDLWSWMIGRFVYIASRGAKTVKRVHITGFLDDEVAGSIEKSLAVDNEIAAGLYLRSLFSSSLAAHIKRLLGTNCGPGGLPLNYSSLTIMFLLEERNAEKEAFSIRPRWRLKTRLSCLGEEIEVVLQRAPGVSEDGVMKEADQVKNAVALFEKEKFVVQNIAEKELQIDPPAPYRLVDILQDGCTILGIGPAGVFRALQKLYYGIEIQGKCTGLITTPLFSVASGYASVMDRICRHLEEEFDPDQIKQRTLDGHAILPLQPSISFEDLQGKLSPEEGQLYELIRSRALASQMLPAAGKTYTVSCAAGGCLFKGRKSSIARKGFLQVFQAGYDPDLLRESSLVDLVNTSELKLERILPEKKGDFPGEYYTFDSLFDDLAEFSIPLDGPSVLILQAMLDSNYLSIDNDGGLHVLQNTQKVTEIVNRIFPSMMGINLSAYFEQTVNEVVSGRKALDFALKQFDQNFMMHGVPLVSPAAPQAKQPLLVKRSSKIIKSPDLTEPVHAKREGPAPGQSQVPERGEEVLEEALEVQEQEETTDSGSDAAPVAAEGGDDAMETAEDTAPPLDNWLADDDDDLEEKDILAGENQEGEELVDDSAGVLADEEGADSEEPLSEGALEVEPQRDEAVQEVRPAMPETSPGEPEKKPVEGVEENKTCPVCARVLLLKSDAYGKYWVCSGYPSCRHSQVFNAEEVFELFCPVCRHESIAVKQTPTGKKMYVCPSPDCEFMAWSKPHAIPCSSCDSPFLVEKKGAGGKMVLRCPRAGCSYQRVLDGAAGGAEESSGEPARKKILVRRAKGAASGSGKKKKIVVRRRK